ncbi:MAG: glycine--tRNA ligase subunit beta [Gammaproteobacteria bacterium]|nr:glycine--tRNA ligase subunit beta [Rhodocyclaceae bacterium]MBU3909387.1 glycine--tRNA ligase subunit beta [Gammaproteobacteria bacterium]MBU3990208.1 glycine--tRNA ligase subunit beta [Gammaproteobacteria bacterium]MBU4005453.1 glycine--tRNA ligase subunit beta [Gammaproteobacteria bacterium]MBU4020994.1 glycine--tRNA ligase subunit beta [Gammaproteobacteria bacterium]
MQDTLLIELLTEELPPKSLAKLGQSFREQMQKSLAEAGFIAAENAGQWFATPRRLALQFTDCLATQPDRVIEKKGPAVASGLGADGKPTKALEGFMRSAGVVFEQLEKLNDGKSEYFGARIAKSGEALDALLAGFVEAALKKLPVAKIMRWGAGEAQFVRPVHGLMLLHGARIVAGQVLGLDSRNITRGHRFMSSGDIVMAHADDYVTTLAKQGKVVAGYDERRAMIRAQLDTLAAGRQWLPDEALLDEVTALVEFPVVYEAGFEAEFLAVPQECLILTMKANQKYFPLFKDGKLTNRFLVVSNMQVADPRHIIGGNERVVRPRLADARFFFNQDRKTPLASRVAKLNSIVYHNKLGSVGERVQRLAKLAVTIAGHLGADKAQAGRAALLAKADLVTDMVGEFPELQGIMGRYYAQHDQEPAAVADAIEGHYYPRGSGDTLPQGNIACAVALADKLDALTGFFGIGQIPTGDKDPFALRRAALGVLRILMEAPLPLDLAELIDAAAAGFAPGLLQGEFKAQLADFMFERLRNLLREAGHEQKLVDAVLALRPTRIDKVPAKLAAVKAFVALPEAAALAAANKRIVNILKKTAVAAGDVDVALLQETAEKALFARLTAITPAVRSFVANEDYADALKALAGLRTEVDAFFDGVMVMAEEPLTRANRLALLRQLSDLMNQVADISKLSS